MGKGIHKLFDKAHKILRWCEKEYGYSKFQNTLAILEIDKELEDTTGEKNKGEYDAYDNIIYLNPKAIIDIEDLVQTIIHEYIHYLQRSSWYIRYYRMGFKTCDSHPYEIQAETKTMEDYKKCLNELKLGK